jgi:hypothetical protein
MAATPAGTELTELHRQAQLQNQQDFLLEFITLWALLDTDRLDDTAPGWIQAVWRAVREYRARSANLSLRYYARYRQVEAPVSAPPLVLPRIEVPRTITEPIPLPSRDRGRLDPVVARRDTRTADRHPTSTSRAGERRTRVTFDDSGVHRPSRNRSTVHIPDITFEREDRAVKASLEVTGPVNQKSKTGRGKPRVVVRDESFNEAAGSAGRHVLTGGRKSLLTVLENDPIAVGWARVTDGDPCAFCAMLASRGVVFGSAAAAGFSAHDHCACTAEPAYSRSAPLPGRGQEFKDLWNREIRGRYSGVEARRAWRRLYEQQRRDQQRGVA